MKKEKILSKIELCKQNIKNIKELCKYECNFTLEKKIISSIYIPEITNIIFSFLNNEIKCINYKHQEELYEQNLLLNIYNERLKNSFLTF